MPPPREKRQGRTGNCRTWKGRVASSIVQLKPRSHRTNRQNPLLDSRRE
jgi:hypothetical protein